MNLNVVSDLRESGSTWSYVCDSSRKSCEQQKPLMFICSSCGPLLPALIVSCLQSVYAPWWNGRLCEPSGCPLWPVSIQQGWVLALTLFSMYLFTMINKIPLGSTDLMSDTDSMVGSSTAHDCSCTKITTTCVLEFQHVDDNETVDQTAFNHPRSANLYNGAYKCFGSMSKRWKSSSSQALDKQHWTTA